MCFSHFSGHRSQDCVARGGHLASIHSSEDFQEIHEAAERAYVMNALFIGAYEPSEGRWEWTDGTAWDEGEMSQISNGAQRDNWDGNNEDEMAYCNSACSNNHGWGDGGIGTDHSFWLKTDKTAKTWSKTRQKEGEKRQSKSLGGALLCLRRYP